MGGYARKRFENDFAQFIWDGFPGKVLNKLRSYGTNILALGNISKVSRYQLSNNFFCYGFMNYS